MSGSRSGSGASTDTASLMSREEARRWLRNVDAELYRTPRGGEAGEAWVAVVRTPRGPTRDEKLIIALGGSMQEAATAAASQWRQVWEAIGRLH